MRPAPSPETRWRRRLGAALVVLGLLTLVDAALAQPAPVSPPPPVATTGATSGVSAGQVLLGQVVSLQGGRNDYGVAVRQGVEAALRQVNAAGGVHGRLLVVKVADDEAKAELAEAAARRLADEGVFLLFGSIEGGPSTAVMKAAVERGLPFFAPMAGSPTLRRPVQPLVFPVRAEHREEFRAILAHGQSLGMRRAALLHADTEVGRQHLANARLAAQALGLDEVVALPMKGEVGDAALEAMVRTLRERQVQMVFNHGSAGVYERLIRRLRAAGLGTALYGVNSGSSQLARHLGPMAHGMVFTQVVPSPWERKTVLTRDYQAAMQAAFPGTELSYGSLEGYLSARALAEALRRAGRELSRPGLLKALEGASFEVAGVRLRYPADEHVGSTFVDTAIVDRDGQFRH